MGHVPGLPTGEPGQLPITLGAFPLPPPPPPTMATSPVSEHELQPQPSCEMLHLTPDLGWLWVGNPFTLRDGNNMLMLAFLTVFLSLLVS